MPQLCEYKGAAHSPQNLPQNKLAEVETELTDTRIYFARLADKLDIDLIAAANNKIKVNELRYPVEKAKGNAKKYSEFYL
ncbi:MAG: MazG-like family protein [Methylococcales bacterium]